MSSTNPLSLSQALDIFLKSPNKPKEDKAHYDKVVAVVSEDSSFILNGYKLQSNEELNLYALVDRFNKEREAQGQLHETLDSLEFAYWLIRNELTTAIDPNSDLEITLIYNIHPFYPSCNDVRWVTRVLKQGLEQLTIEDVYLLALYRDTVLDGVSIENTVITRDIYVIKQLLIKMVIKHQTHLKQHTVAIH